jgi:hypothetical protein
MFLAHRVQRPREKINHALLLGGAQGIGKDTLLEPVKRAVGHWNFGEASPSDMFASFNKFQRSVILRVSEGRDLGDVDRFKLYDRMKTVIARAARRVENQRKAPEGILHPELLQCNYHEQL